MVAVLRKAKDRPSSMEVWLTAARPHTLTASLCPCLVAYAATRPPWKLQVLWTIFCMTVQLGTNLHNDYSDFVQGADTDLRVGHARATAKGWLSPTQTCTAACGSLMVTLLSGIALAVETQQTNNAFLWFLILSSVFNAFAYTAGPFPLGYIGLGQCSIAYAGLGDVFVLLYFGYVAVLMLPFLVSGSDGRAAAVDWPSQWLFATQVGLLATNIIVVNNLRDRHTDIAAQKRTTSVRFGRNFSLVQYIVCQVVSYALVFAHVFRSAFTAKWETGDIVYTFLWQLLPLLSVPLAVKETLDVFSKDGEALNAHVGGAAKVQLAFCVLLSMSIWLSS
jgi:1,4-dihydroxy-2-naphthoate polyprenyltransferase